MKNLNEYIVNEAKMQLSPEDAVKFLQDIKFPKKFNVNLNIDEIGLSDNLVSQLISRSIGSIVEGVIFACIQRKYENNSKYEFTVVKNSKNKEAEESNSCDCYIKDKETGETLDLEVKAYKQISNPHLTGKQSKCFILGVKYSVKNNTIAIEEMIFGTAKDGQQRLNAEFKRNAIVINNEESFIM